MLILKNLGADMRHYRDRSYHGSSHSDDATLWVLIQRVCRREDDKERRLQAAAQLQEFVTKAEHKQTLSRCLEQILNALIDVFFERSGVNLQKDVAVVIGLIGHQVSNEPYPFFQWMLRQFQNIANDNVKNYLLESLKKVLELDLEERKFGKVITMLMDELQAALENIDSPEHLPTCINPIILIAQNYPAAFSKHFCDTVDILVGWHIDHTQKMSLTLFASASLVKLHTHWLTDLQFSLTLLSQFLEDMEAYAEDYHKLQSSEATDDGSASTESCLPKMAALMRVFSTVVRSIGPVFHPNNGPPITEAFILETLQRIIVCAQLAGDGSLSVTCAADECARLLLGAVQWRGEDMLSESLLTYAVHAVEKSRTEPRLLLVLDFITVMVQEVGSALPSWFIQGLLGPSSRLLPLKHARNPKLGSELLALYQACLAVKSVPLLQTAYRHVAGELQHAINALLSIHARKTLPGEKLNAIVENPFESDGDAAGDDKAERDDVDLIIGSYEEKHLKTATFDIVALHEIADAKNSLIGMYALSPSIFELLHTGLETVHTHLAALFPSLQYALLHTLYSHCQRHKHFLSSFLGGSPVPPVDASGGGTSFMDNVTTATYRHYPSILDLLTKLLIQKTTSSDARTLLLHWTKEILDRLKTSKDSSLITVDAFAELTQSLATVAVSGEPKHCTVAAQCLQTALVVTSGPSTASLPMTSTLHDTVTQCCLVQLWSVEPAIRKAYAELLCCIPLDKVMLYGTSRAASARVKKAPKLGRTSTQQALPWHDHHDSRRAKHIVIGKQGNTGGYHAHHFKDVMDRLLKTTILGGMDVNFLEKMYWNCQRRNRHQNGTNSPKLPEPVLPPLAVNDQSFILWWSLWQCAEYTVTNKLRTPLGRPQDTFQKIEGAIREYEQKLIAGNLSITLAKTAKLKETSPRPTAHTDMSLAALQRPHLMLQFLDNLEKLLYNGYEGCAVAIPPPGKAVRTFFSTNRQTCEQWLNRLHLVVMRVSLTCGLPALAFHHGETILHDMKSKKNTSGLEFESAIVMSVEALISLKSPQGIEGLYRWCRELGGTKQQWAWMKAAKVNASVNYEDTVKEYRQILISSKQNDKNSDGSSSTEKETKKTFNPAKILISKQLIRSYTELSNWTELEEWIQHQACEDSKVDLFAGNDYLKALGKFEDLDIPGASEKCQALLKGSGKSPSSPVNGVIQGSTCWDWTNLQRMFELQAINGLKCLDANDSWKSSLQPMMRAALDCTRIMTSYWPPSVMPPFYAHYATACAIKKAVEQKEKFLSIPLSAGVPFADWMASSSGCRLLTFMEVNEDERESKAQKSVSAFAINVIKGYRKHGNCKTAQNLLLHQISKLSKEEIDSPMVDLLTCCRSLPETADSSPFILDVKYESAKVLHAIGRGNDAVTLLSEMTSGCIENGLKTSGLQCSKALLTLVKYLQADWKNFAPTLKECLGPNGPTEEVLLQKLWRLMKMEQHTSFSFAANRQLHTEVNQEIVLGSLLNMATVQAPNLAKSWFALAGWCYKWGRKLIDGASTAGSVELTEDETNQVQSILLPLGVSEEQLEDVYGVLRKAHCSAASVQMEGDTLDDILVSQGDHQNYTVISDAFREQLNSRCGSWLARAHPQINHSLLAIWQRVCLRLFAHYRLAAHAYFKFLSLNAVDQKYEDGNVTATLRLLRLLVKHALELQGTLKNGIATTPTSPWKGIIPQLFSRLNHPEPYVQRSIAELLCRVAVQSPYLIIYPVVVATTRADPRAHKVLRSTLDEDEDNEDDEEQEALDKSKLDESDVLSPDDTGVNSCYKRVLQALVQQSEPTVRDVQLLVIELRRITLLWDELWLGTLNQHHHDIMRRLQQLQDEAKRVNSNNTLSKTEKKTILREQQQAIMRPVVYAMRRVQRITNANPETAHERWFADNVQTLIDQALEKLQNPPNPHNPQSCWSGFKQIHSLLQNRASKRATHILNLGEISPRLMTLKSTTMPIPGVTDAQHPITIEGCSSAVTILPTKTKPKKLQFIGSDGRRYTYLFKGLEDLHLDERIMQFLSIANCLLHRQHENRGYAARHYSVTPLGARSGLIQWVSGATPLFLLYKRWQQRQAVMAANKQATANSVMPNIQIMRPSDLYYSKLTPAMKKAEVDMERTSRKDWPIDVQRSVLKELLEETPNDLLQKELWCSATGPAEYWNMQQKYSQSTAVMSMIGYVIGLGDRHLDNVLVDLGTGEVVHIDYNVCFEKGLQLRVPERVPFRLTQNLLRALGLSGVEGVFRNSCEQVLSTLRKGKETLLTLLEAFVYDPLVDWTGTVEGGYAGAVYGGGGQQVTSKVEGDEERLSKKDMEREITRSLFSSRIAEMKQGWFNNRDEMLKALPLLVDRLNAYKTHFKNNVGMSEKMQNLQEVKSQVKSALSDSRHPYNNLPYRWHQHKQQQNKKETALSAMQDKIASCEVNMKRWALLLSVLQSPELAALLADASTALELGPCAFEHASKFLHSAGQSNMVSQSQQTEKELCTVSEQRRHAMRSCLDVLSQYAAVAGHFPPHGVLRGHWEAVWRTNLERMVDGLLNMACGSVRAEIEKNRSKETMLTQTRVACVKDSTLQREVNNLNGELVKLIERRSVEPIGVGKVKEAERMVGKQRDNIINFVKESGRDSLGPLTAVLTMLFCALDQQAIAMERAAAAAGHRLVDMTSQEGDWFLEELCGLFANVVQLLHVGDILTSSSPDLKPSGAIKDAYRAVTSADNVFRTLLELFNNFRNIIVPEAVKHLQCEEPSVIELVTAVTALLQGVRLDELTKQLMGHMRNQGVQNGTSSPYEDALSDVQGLQRQYSQLLQDSKLKRSDEHRLTAGQMLLQAFDGLFSAVQKDFLALLSTRERFNVPREWTFVDALNEPLQLQKFKNLSGSSETLQAILFVKQLQAMHDFFVLCQSSARAFLVDRIPTIEKNAMAGHHYVGSKSIYTEERLAKPIKHFISYFVQELLIGVPSEVLGYATCSYIELHGVELSSFVHPNAAPPFITDDICKRVVESKYSQAFLSKPSMLVYQFNRAWKELDRAQRLDSNLVAARSSLQRAQLQVTRFQWLHEDLLETGSNVNFVLPRRRDVITDLNKRMGALRHLDQVFQQVQEKASSQNTSIQQRLKWAAGANPSLQKVLSSVEVDVQTRSRFTDKEATLSGKILEICENAVVFERSRLSVSGSASANENEVEFIRLLDNCESVCRVLSANPVQIDDQERTAVEILAPKPGMPTEEWLQKVSEKLHSSVTKYRQQRQQEEQKMSLVKSKLRDLVASVKQLLSGHGRLLSDVKALLKTMAKAEDGEEENSADAPSGVGSVRKYMERYKDLTSTLNDTLMDVLQGCDAGTMLDPDPLIERLTNIVGMVTGVYEDLVAFANPYLDNTSNQPTFATALKVGTGLPLSNVRNSPGPKKPTALGAASGSQAPATPSTPPLILEGPGAATETGASVSKSATVAQGVPTPKKKVRDPKTGKAIQERNYFAVNVWRKVKAKLDGRDVDSGKRLQPSEQVDQVISEATSFDNLALLYEGWTAWV